MDDFVGQMGEGKVRSAVRNMHRHNHIKKEARR